MLSFITFVDSLEQVEIVVDEEGAKDLIQYLEYVVKNKNHMHLVIDTELDPYPIGDDRIGKTLNAKHVRVEFSEKSNWEN